MGTSVGTPAPRDYYQETADTLQAQVQLAPSLYAAEAQFSPQYTTLGLSNLQDYLLGTQGGTRTVMQDRPSQTLDYKTAKARGLIEKISRKDAKAADWSSGLYGRKGGGGSGFNIGAAGLFGSGSGPKYFRITDAGQQQGFRFDGKSISTPGASGPIDIQVPEQRGLLDIYQRDIYPTLSAIEAADAETRRAADLAAIEKYGQSYTDALLNANPQQRALLDEMNRQAIEELQARQSLTDPEKRSAQQAARSAFAARGLGYGNQAIAQELFNNYQLGAQRQAQRRQFAAGVMAMNQSAVGDPFLQVLGRPSTLVQQGLGFGQQGQAGAAAIGPTLFNPESQYAGDIFNQRYQTNAAGLAASAANRAALASAGIQAAGSILGGAASMCWVARQVFGADDPRWVAFRDWLLTDAPTSLRDVYARYGRQVADWISTRPRAKAVLRRIMEGVI